jgi:hypothetical protein
VALTYIVEAFFSALAGYFCWRIYGGAAQFVFPGAMAIGVAAGFRPSSLLLLLPLLLFSFCGVSRKQAGVGGGILVFTLLAWFIPMLRIGSGARWMSSLFSLWLTVPSRGTVFNSSFFNSVARAGLIAGIYFLFFGCAAILPVLGISARAVDPSKKLFTWVWIAPGLIVFTFVYLKVVNSGYLLVLSPPVCAWMGLWASNWYADSRLRRPCKILAIACCAVVNTAVFVSAPVYSSYGKVREFETELENILRILPQIASPHDTMIVGFDSHFLGYRHAGYYLPQYLTAQFPEVELAFGRRVFVMQDRNTSLKGTIPPRSIRHFIFFPLLQGDNEAADYMAMLRSRFPPGELRTTVRGGCEFTIGPVTDLPLLFPASAPSGNTLVH